VFFNAAQQTLSTWLIFLGSDAVRILRRGLCEWGILITFLPAYPRPRVIGAVILDHFDLTIGLALPLLKDPPLLKEFSAQHLPGARPPH
jgi:hypothetical protein